jgi:hypothetical protein
MQLLCLMLNQVVNILRRHIESIGKEIEPKFLLLLMRRLRFQVILYQILRRFILAGTQLIVRHLGEEYYVLAVKHRHQYFKEELSLNLPHL